VKKPEFEFRNPKFRWTAGINVDPTFGGALAVAERLGGLARRGMVIIQRLAPIRNDMITRA